MTGPVLRTILLGAAAISAVLSMPAVADVVGTTGAANVRSTGTPPGGGTRTIEIGTQVVHNEKIETSASGSLHIIFIDKTTLNIGPNSTLIINDFVYNPSSGTGQMAATLARGVMRIVGGQVTHTGGAQIKTPAATIGVRGGVATIRHCLAVGAGCSQPGTRAINHFGVLTAANGGGVETISRPGFGTFVTGGGSQPPTSPARVSQGEIDANNQQLTSQGGARGGNGQRPTDGQAAQAGLGRANGGAQPLNINPQGAPGQQQGGQFPNGNPAQQGAQQSATNNVVSSTQQQIANSNAAARTFVITTTAGAGSKVPFLTASFVGSGAFNVSPIYGYKPENSTTTAIMQASMGVNGEGAAQTSFLSVFVGRTGQPGGSGDYGLAGKFEGSSLQQSKAIPTHATGFASSTDSNAAFKPIPVDGSGVPNGSFDISQNDLRAGSNGVIAGYPYQAYQYSDGSASSYAFSQSVAPSTPPAGLGASRPEQTLTGYASALFTHVYNYPSGQGQFPGPFFIASNSAGQQSAVSLSMFANGQMSANFTLDSYHVDASGVVAPNLGDTAVFRFGSDGSSNYSEARGSYIDSRVFAALGQEAKNIGPTSTVGGSPLSSDGLVLVSSDAVNAASLFPNVKLCVCDYTRWGFWSATPVIAGSTDASYGYSNHIGLWVAGIPTKAVDMPNVGSATYSGHVIAAISNNNSQYLAASNMISTVDFGTGAATINVANLDGFQYSGARQATPGGIPTTFQFAATGTALPGAPSRITPILSGNGGFFASASHPAGSMAGSVYVTAPAGQNYLGTGIFAAQR